MAKGFTLPAEDVEAALGRGVMRAVMPEAKPTGSATEKGNADREQAEPKEDGEDG